MKYYQKNNMMYYKIDESTFSLTEMFTNSTQNRIMVVNNSKSIFMNIQTRIAENGFTEITEQEFNNIHQAIKTKI